jgi:uncharacterized SAM-binding protein YcdF (DUF218 family)
VKWLAAGIAVWLGGAVLLDVYGRAHRPNGRFDAIVVAGAKVWRGARPSKALARRTAAGVVGEHGPAESVLAAQLARDSGVPESALRREERSTNTIENAAFAHELLGPVSVLVVTDSHHVLRCEIIYRYYFPRVQVVGLPIGRTPAMVSALREVAALAVLPFTATWRWLRG